MSIRAHRVIEIVTGDIDFNLWNDEEVVNLLGDNLFSSLNMDGCGLVELIEPVIEEALDKATQERTKEILEKMLRDAQANGGYITYYCY